MSIARGPGMIVIGVLLMTACSGPGGSPSESPTTPSDASSSAPFASWRTDFSRLADHVSESDFVRALPRRDAIPPLSLPAMITAAEVTWIFDDEPVIAVERNGEWRAYPLQILLWHEIVNDEVGGEPIVVTFCPLCHTSVVFDPHLDGSRLEFGVTGYLRRSDLVMYDRQTESWWQQATGVGLVGLHAGRHLEILPSSIVAWADFLAAHPDARVLDRATGYDLPYGRSPYPGWDLATDNPFFKRIELLACDEGAGCVDPKERVGVVIAGGETVVFPFRRLASAGGLIETEIGGMPVLVWWQPAVRTVLGNALLERADQVGTVVAFDRDHDGTVLSFTATGETLVDDQTGTTWNALGEATAGPLTGERLRPLQVDTPYWFGYAAFDGDHRIWPDG
jgi:hypothetical protein